MPLNPTDLEWLDQNARFMTPADRCDFAKIHQQDDVELAESSLHEFVKQAWHVVEPTTVFQDSWHIGAICDHLQAVSDGEIRNLIINVPPRCMKSLAVSVFWPCWHWIEHPSSRWLFASYAGRLSARDSVKCRDIIRSSWYEERWGKIYSLKDDQNVKTRFENTETGLRLATSVGATATGEGGDFLVVDDCHNVEQAQSDSVRQGQIDWFDTTLSTRGNNPKTVAKVVVMQRLHELDLTGHLLENHADEWEYLCLPMEYEPSRHCVTSIGWEDPRASDRISDLLWPDQFGEPEIASLRSNLGAYAAAGQLQQRPAPDTGGMFQRSNYRYFKVIEATDDDITKRVAGQSVEDIEADIIYGVAQSGEAIYELATDDGPRRYFESDCQLWQTADTALKTGQENDYTAIATIVITPDYRILIREMIREKVPVPKQFDLLMAQRAKWPTLRFQAVESAASGIGLIQQGQMEGCPFKELKADRDKITRAVPLATFIENHRVYHLAGAAWLAVYEDELANFPVGAHDDQVDAVAHGALLVATKARAAWELEVEKKQITQRAEPEKVDDGWGDV